MARDLEPWEAIAFRPKVNLMMVWLASSNRDRTPARSDGPPVPPWRQATRWLKCQSKGSENGKYRMNRRRRAFSLFGIAVGLLLTVAFGWSYYQTSNQILYDAFKDTVPRSFPYPDLWVVQLNDWFEKRYPAPPGVIKLHGELPRVRAAIWLGLICSIIVTLVSSIAFIYGPFCRWRRRRRGLCLKCGYNLEGDLSGVCPECGEAR